MSSQTKSAREQVREIRKLLADAEETLAQARWALETLEARLDEDEDAGTG
ncbi:MAG TPA: hypothetical protein VNS09_13150 [Solirubrobacter sp.]|nr:hypothetical protein [Solirubrobacter sp.]